MSLFHELKCWPEYFEKLFSGDKKFEIRKDDRNYRVGDDLILKEYVPPNSETGGGGFTGRIYRARVTYIYRGEMCAPGFCVLSIKKLPMITRLRNAAG